MITVYFTFLSIFFGLNKKSRIAKNSLIYETNFDLPESTQADVLILFRILFRMLKKLFNANKTMPSEKHEAEVAGLGESANVWDSHNRFNSVNQLPPIELKLNYSDLMDDLSWKEFFSMLLLSSMLLPLIIVPSFISMRRASFAICVLYACHVYLIDSRLTRANSKSLIDYTAYSNQSNWLVLVLMRRGIEVIKIPSIGPFAGHFKHAIASKLWLSTPYHQDESRAFEKTHLVGEYLKGKPKNAFYLDKYEAAHLMARPKVLGYYSHASWVRADQDHGASEFGLPEMESILLCYIVEYCLRHPSIKLHVFTHPRERKPHMLARTEAYYYGIISEQIDAEIDFGKEKSSLSFEAAEVGVGTMSSILFERLLCGFKTLFYTEGMVSFPVPNSDISSICAPDKDKLYEMLDKQFASASHAILDRYRYDAEFYTQKL